MPDVIANCRTPLDERFPQRATLWKLRTRTLTFGRRPVVMGIVNVTPDSFSDGGQYFAHDAAVEHALQLANSGAAILDIGGESTRPYSDPVSEQDELDRVIPVIGRLARELADSNVVISIDTSKATVAAKAVRAGAEIINDISGLQGDPQMVDVACDLRPGICAMHMQGTPQTMQDNPTYDNISDDILRYLQSRRDALTSLGIPQEQICLDPGIGFGKTLQHNLTLMNTCDLFHQLGCPVLVGHSRKGFIGKLVKNQNSDRLAATVGATMVLAQRGIQIVRVHDVEAVIDGLTLFEACGGIDGNVIQLD